MSDVTNVIRFPIEKRIDKQAADAVREMARAELIDEREAVAAFRALGMPDDEIDLLRTIAAVNR